MFGWFLEFSNNFSIKHKKKIMFRSISASCKLAGLVTSASFFMLKSCKDDTSELGQNLVGYPIVAKSECKSSDCMKSPVGSGVSIKGKVVLITGATSGIGEACAHRFAEEGSKLILIGRRESRLDSIKTHLTAKYHGLQVRLNLPAISSTFCNNPHHHALCFARFSQFH